MEITSFWRCLQLLCLQQVYLRSADGNALTVLRSCFAAHIKARDNLAGFGDSTSLQINLDAAIGCLACRTDLGAIIRLYLYELEGLVGAGRLIEIFLSDYWLNLISNPEIC